MIGPIFSHYRILEPIGSGGMGAVYRAHDSRLDRDVALKVIRPESSADPTARARLLREARTASRLNHPHVCTIHEVGEADGQLYIAMELVRGQPLDTLIPPGGLPLDGVLRYGAQIADALAHAHEHGVIHRDLKTANVMVTGEGRAKVLDFGLARRSLHPAEGEPLLPSVTLTETGAVVGTPSYQAPELLRGAKSDARSDLWALGVLLYEMAAGRLPFEGATVPELCAAILNQPVPPLPERVPAGLRAVILRCLAKEPGRRFRGAGEVRAALEALQGEELAPRAVARPRRRRGLVFAGVAIAVVGAAAIVGLFLWKRSSQTSPQAGSERGGWKQQTFVGKIGGFVLSPDGRTLAYTVVEPGQERLMVQDVTGGEALEVFKGRYFWPLQWSSTGSDIVVLSVAEGEKIYEAWLVPRMGGQARSLSSYSGFGWPHLSPDGAFLAEKRALPARIELTQLAGGDTSWVIPLSRFDEEVDEVYAVDWSPDAKMLLFVVSGQVGHSVWTMRRDGSMQRKLYEAEGGKFQYVFARWAPRGGAIYCRLWTGNEGQLIKVYVNPDGSPSRRAPRVLISDPALGLFSVSNDGRRLACARWAGYSNLWLWEPLPRGRGAPPRQLTHGTASHWRSRLSPDGERVAYLSDRGGANNAHVLSIADGQSRQLTFMEKGVYDLAWSPDGRSIAFTAYDGDTVRVWQIPAGGGTPTPLRRTRLTEYGYVAWGTKLFYHTPSGRNFTVLDLETGAEHALIRSSSVGWLFGLAESPDGMRVAVWWNHVKPKIARGLWVVSAVDSAQQRLLPYDDIGRFKWSSDGKALHYIPDEPPWRLVRVTYPRGDTTTLIRAPFEKLNEDKAWKDLDFTTDLRRFVYAAGESNYDVWLLENFDPEVR